MLTTTRKFGTAMIVLAAITTGTSFATEADASTRSHMETAGRTLTPIGHALFCQQVPQECVVNKASTAKPKLTRKRWKRIVSINARVNAAVKPVTDQEYYGVEEHWTYPDAYGDCEDYVLLKRHMLLKAGFPASSLLITVVKQPNGEGHAVLTVRTDRADYVLDNLTSKVRQWDETPYKYLKRQSTKHAGKWIKIRDRRAQVASF